MKLQFDIHYATEHLLYVKHDYEVYGVSRPTRNGAPMRIRGLPETLKASTRAGSVRLDEPLQRYLFDLLTTHAPPEITMDDLKRAWASFTADDRAFTNNAGSTTQTDYINETNLGVGPMMAESIVTGGCLLKPTGRFWREQWEVKVLNALKPLPDMSFYERGWNGISFIATNSVREIVNGVIVREDIVEGFPQLRGADCVWAFLANEDTVWVDDFRVRLIRPGQPFPLNPYHL